MITFHKNRNTKLNPKYNVKSKNKYRKIMNFIKISSREIKKKKNYFPDETTILKFMKKKIGRSNNKILHPN